MWFPNRHIPCGLIFAPGVSAVAGCKKLLGMPVVLLSSFGRLLFFPYMFKKKIPAGQS